MQKSSSLSLSRPTLRWTRLTQLVSLNTPGFANGVLVLYANDTLALAQTGIVYRTSKDVTLKNVLFSTFFGGSDSTWDSTGGDAYFRKFAVSSPSPLSCPIRVNQNLNGVVGMQVWYGPDSSNTTGPAVNATFSSTDAPPGSTSRSSKGQSTPLPCIGTLLLLLFIAFCISA